MGRVNEYGIKPGDKVSITILQVPLPSIEALKSKLIHATATVDLLEDNGQVGFVFDEGYDEHGFPVLSLLTPYEPHLVLSTEHFTYFCFSPKGDEEFSVKAIKTRLRNDMNPFNHARVLLQSSIKDVA